MTWFLAVEPFPEKCVLEAADEIDLVVAPHDVVAGYQAAEQVVKIRNTGAHGRLRIRARHEAMLMVWHDFITPAVDWNNGLRTGAGQ